MNHSVFDFFKIGVGPSNSHTVGPMTAARAFLQENAAGGRVVAAPTNGAAGIITAVLEYYRVFESDADDEGILRFVLTQGNLAGRPRRQCAGVLR